MRKKFYSIILGLLILHSYRIFGSENNDLIIGSWIFQSMSTTYYSDPAEKEIIKKDNDHNEILIFSEDGTFNYKGKTDGDLDQGVGLWIINEEKLTTVVDNEKTISEYSIIEGVLTITTNEIETEEYFATKSIIVYQKQ
tara:strand:- start:2282 stop:2698 length:417 start_codon:yes stop_codon:yes gene_type:complete